MKKHLLLSLITALAASTSFAETYYTNIPFDFVVGDKTIPAGEYLMNQAALTGIVSMSSSDHKTNFFVVGSSETSMDDKRPAQLVFHRYGDRYFLFEVWTRGGDSGRRLPMGPGERELRAQSKTRQSEIVVALR